MKKWSITNLGNEVVPKAKPVEHIFDQNLYW